MTKPKFKVGDRVVMTVDTMFYNKGAKGKIKSVDPEDCWVHFTKGGFDRRNNSMWCVGFDQMKLIKPRGKK